MTKAAPGYPRGAGYGVKTNMSPWSLPCVAQLPTRPSGPAGVTAVATALTESIALTWSAPTTHADGTALKEGELLYYYVYHSKSNSIDITNPGTYEAREQVDAERYQFDVPDPAAYLGPYYFVVTAVNTEAMQSVASAEVGPVTAASQITGPSVVDDWGAGNAESILVGKARIFVRLRLPKTTWNDFGYYKVYFDVDAGGGFTTVWTYLSSERIGYSHAPLVEASKYKYKVTVVGKDGTETAGSIHDNGGPGYQPNAVNNNLILADTIAAGTIISSGDMIARTFIGGAIQSTTWAAAAGSQIDLDNEALKFGGSGVDYDTGTGIFAGLHGGNYKLFVGAALGNKVLIDPTAGTVEIVGTIKVTGGPLLGQPGGANVLYDPGMEQAATPYWGDNGARQAAGGNDSNAWWKITRAGSNLYDYARDHDGSIRYIEVNPGEVWEYGGDLWSDGTATAVFFIRCRDKDLVHLADSAELTSAVNAWAAKGSSYTVPANGKFLQVYAAVTTANGDIGFDNCYLRRADLDWSYIQNVVVQTADIENLAVTTGKIGNLQVTTGKIGNLQVTGAKIANATITNAQIGSLDAGKITAGTLHVDRIAATSIVAGKLSIAALSAIAADLGAITSGSITGAEIRTAASGARAVMSSTGGYGTAHAFEVHDATRIRAILLDGGLQLWESDGNTGVVLDTAGGYGRLDLRDHAGVSQIIFAGENSATPAYPYIAYFRNNHATSGIPVLWLDQDDISEGFIDFVGSDRGVIDEGVSSVESVRVEVNGVVRRLAVYADA